MPQDTISQAEILRDAISDFVGAFPSAVVKQGGTTLFALDTVECTVSAEYRRCVVYFWADFLNMRRTVVDVETVKGCLRLTTARLGTKKQEVLWLTPDASTHAIASIDIARLRYAELLRRAIHRDFADTRSAFLNPGQTSLVQLERSGPCLRGMVKEDGQRWAVIGISRHERLESIDALLRYGLIWLSKCRESARTGRVAGLKIFCPRERSSPMKFRVAWLACPDEVQFYELDESTEELFRFEPDRESSCRPDIVIAFKAEVLVERCLPALAELLLLLPSGAAAKIDLQPMSPSLLSVRLKGLEFAAVCYEPEAGSIRLRANLYHCVGRKRVRLVDPEAKRRFKLNMAALFEQRDADAVRTTAFYRTGADAWLAKVVRNSITDYEPHIDPTAIYRAVECSTDGIADSIDLLAISRKGQLIIIHVCARENTLFPRHGLDQWIRIRELNRSGQLREAGYFPGHVVSQADPCLIFVAPALRLRQDNEAILGYISREVCWTYIAVGEDWRHLSHVIYRKQSEKPTPLRVQHPAAFATAAGR